MESAQEGLLQGVSHNASKVVLSGVKKVLGDKYPEFFDTELVKRLETQLVCASVIGRTIQYKSSQAFIGCRKG